MLIHFSLPSISPKVGDLTLVQHIPACVKIKMKRPFTKFLQNDRGSFRQEKGAGYTIYFYHRFLGVDAPLPFSRFSTHVLSKVKSNFPLSSQARKGLVLKIWAKAEQ